MTVANDASSKVTVASGKPRCCWQVEKDDLDCDVSIVFHPYFVLLVGLFALIFKYF
jgi:hypothetical protein